MICSKCGAEVAEGAMFCTTCGAPMNAAAPNPVPNPAPTPAPTPDTFAGNGAPVYAAPIYMDPKDHTAEYSAKDISDNKVIALLPYLMGTMGLIIAILAQKDSAYVAFHVRQALKLTVCTVLVGFISLILCWTIIVPIIGAIAAVVLLVVDIICFFRVCSGKAIEAPIVSSFGFLK